MQAARLGGRMQQELKMLQDPPPGVCAWPSDNHRLSRLEAQIEGPDDTVYSNGIFKLDVQIPERYPFEPPKVKFITPIYHPNIDSGGRICHDILNMPPKGRWSPSLNITQVLASIRVLMVEPDPDDGLMSDITAEYKHNRARFDANARLCTQRHAMETVAQKEVGLSSDRLPPAAEQQIPNSSNDIKNSRAVSEESKNMGASEMSRSADGNSASTSGKIDGLPNSIQSEPWQSLNAKLSLGKGATISVGRESSKMVITKETAGRDPTTGEVANIVVPMMEAKSGRGTQRASFPEENISQLAARDKGSDITNAGKIPANKENLPCAISKAPHIPAAAEALGAEAQRKVALLNRSKPLKLSRPQVPPIQDESGRASKKLESKEHIALAVPDHVICLDSGSDEDDLPPKRIKLRAKHKTTAAM